MFFTEKNIPISDIITLIIIQLPVNYLFYILYQPYVVHPWTNMAYFLVLFIIGYFLTLRYGSFENKYNDSKESIFTLIWTTISMFLIYLFLRYRFVILEAIPFFNTLENLEKGRIIISTIGCIRNSTAV